MELPWTEKYRPQKLSEIVGQEAITERLEAYVKTKSIPHLLFAGPAGSGKTTAAICIAKELFHDIKYDFLELNASVTPETPIMVRENNNRIKRTNFGELASKYFKDQESKYSKTKNLEILSLDKDYKIKFIPVNLISRHKVSQVARIKYEGGEVRTSLDHSVMVINEEGDIISKKVSDLEKGNMLVTFTTVMEGKNNLIDFKATQPKLYTNLKGHWIRNPKVRNVIENMEMNEDLAWLFGAYLAEGCLSFRDQTSGVLVFTFGYPHELDTAKNTQRILEENFNLESDLSPEYSGFNRSKASSIQLRVCNTQLANFMKENFYNNGKTARFKRTPSFIYDCSLGYRLEFLKGYMNDATGNWEEYVRYSSRSHENLIDITWLGRISGLNTSCFKDEARLVWELPSYSYIKTQFFPAEFVINLLQEIDDQLEINWRYHLRHQLYSKKSKRISKELVKDLLSKIKIKINNKKIKNALKLINSPLSVVLIKKIDIEEYDDFVYDVSVPEGEMFWGGTAPILLHNSDERGIDVVRGKIKDFARTRSMAGNFKIIFLDEADALTPEAQNALRRTMENYSSVTRFILSCNYSSKIIEPLQSRCALFRFKRISKEAIEKRLREILEKENVEFTSEGLHAIIYVSEGDMRHAINVLQSTAAIGKVDEENVYSIASQARPQDVQNLINLALDGKFLDARNLLDRLILKYGMSGEDILLQMNREVMNLKIPDEKKVRIIDLVGEANFTLVEGANERIQLEALLARIMVMK